MPVTFETDLKDLKNFDYVPQVPLEALFKNLGYKQAKYDQGFQQAQRVADQLKVKAYGQDAIRRDAIIKDVNHQLQQFSGADFSDPAVVNKFSSYVNTVASNPELVGMEARASYYDQMKAKRDKITADGSYLSPSNDPTAAMESYYNGQEPYNPNKRFTGNVYKQLDWLKAEDTVANQTEAEEHIDPNKMYDDKYKQKTYARFKDNWNNFVNKNPEYKAELERKFNYENQGTDWNNVSALETYQGIGQLKKVQSQYGEMLNRQGISDTERARIQANIDDAKTQEAILTENFKNLNPSARRSLAYQSYLDENSHKFAIGRVSTSHTDHTLNKAYELGLKADLDLRNAQKEEVLKLAGATGRVNIDDEGNIISYEPGTIPVKPSSGGRTVKVGNQTVDYDYFNQAMDSNNVGFVQSVVADKDFKITKDGKTLYPSALTSSKANPDGTYTITGKFSEPEVDKDNKPVTNDKGVQANKIVDGSITVTAKDIKNSYLGSNVSMTKKMAPPNGTYSVDQKQITTNQGVSDKQGNIVIPKGTTVKSYPTATDAAKDASLPDNSYFFDESTNTYKKIGK